MSNIRIKDKEFVPYLTAKEIDSFVEKIAQKINKDFHGKEVLFLAILNGSFMFTSDLLKKIKVDCEISFVKVSSYSGTSSTGHVHKLIGLMQSLHGKHVIILEDIIDTGCTLEKLLPSLQKEQASSLNICTLLYKPDAFQAQFEIKYIGKKIPNKFVVGYGLDYDQKGRNFKEIYQLKE